VQRTMMKSKIHRATVTGADVDYVGSITLDPELMRLAAIREFEQVHVLDIDNGARFETYAMAGRPGDVILNGAAARLVHVDECNRPIPAEQAVARAGSNLVWMRTGAERGRKPVSPAP